MSVGDLIHLEEHHAPAAQVAIVAQSASRWYSAHLLLFIALLLLVPGFLALANVAMDRKPTAGYAARLLLIASVGAFSAVFAFEMLLGLHLQRRRPGDRGGPSRNVLVRPLRWLLPGLLAFFIGIALAVMSLASSAGPFRWPVLCLALGAFLILGEIILAEVLLSQIGNILILVAGIAFARVLLRRPEGLLV